MNKTSSSQSSEAVPETSAPSPLAPSPLAPSPGGMDASQIEHAEKLAHKSTLQRVLNGIAFAFSALLSPYLVIPVGTVGIVATQSASRRTFVLWTFISVLFSTVIPALYVLFQIWRGKITDVHVMEREQRSGPFVVAVISSALGALVLRSLGAPSVVWGIGIVLLINGVILLWITSFWKISMHVAVLSSVVLACTVMIRVLSFWQVAWLIPALMWARYTRGRHTLWQGLAGCIVSCALTAAAFSSVRLWYLVEGAWHRVFS